MHQDHQQRKSQKTLRRTYQLLKKKGPGILLVMVLLYLKEMS
jgi:hypothetical protein